MAGRCAPYTHISNRGGGREGETSHAPEEMREKKRWKRAMGASERDWRRGRSGEQWETERGNKIRGLGEMGRGEERE